MDPRPNLLLEYVEVPFPFQAFDELFRQGVRYFLQSRCRRVAIRIWNNTRRDTGKWKQAELAGH